MPPAELCGNFVNEGEAGKGEGLAFQRRVRGRMCGRHLCLGLLKDFQSALCLRSSSRERRFRRFSTWLPRRTTPLRVFGRLNRVNARLFRVADHTFEASKTDAVFGEGRRVSDGRASKALGAREGEFEIFRDADPPPPPTCARESTGS